MDFDLSPQKLHNLLEKTEKAFQTEKKKILPQFDSDEVKIYYFEKLLFYT